MIATGTMSHSHLWTRASAVKTPHAARQKTLIVIATRVSQREAAIMGVVVVLASLHYGVARRDRGRGSGGS